MGASEDFGFGLHEGRIQQARFAQSIHSTMSLQGSAVNFEHDLPRNENGIIHTPKDAAIIRGLLREFAEEIVTLVQDIPG